MEVQFRPGKGIWCEDRESIEKLEKNHFGTKKGGKIFLEVEEALYLISFQNAVCIGPNKEGLSFNGLAAYFESSEPRLYIKYNAYRDWRDRGLIVKRITKDTQKSQSSPRKRYPMTRLEPNKLKARIYWYPKSLFSVLEDKKVGKELFDGYWLGQFGIYKQDRGSLTKFNFLETVFLAKHFGVTIINIDKGKRITHAEVLKQVMKEREYTKQLYDVYEEWRLRGYVVKTGFKFGSHFRIYFTGASPAKGGKWVHSKHVLHVFPKEEKLLISEWSRAVRVAHGVKKTFLLGIPKLKEKDYVDYPSDFVAYRRKKEKGNWIRETPEDGPRYLLVPVSEDEHIGGVELASLLEKADKMGLELLLSITDRETSITYYVLKKILLAGSQYEYYEIEWMKP